MKKTFALLLTIGSMATFAAPALAFLPLPDSPVPRQGRGGASKEEAKKEVKEGLPGRRISGAVETSDDLRCPPNCD